MNRLIRFYNQNRKNFWFSILILIFAFFILRILNYIAKVNNKKIENHFNVANISTTIYIPEKSAISDSKVEDNQFEGHNELISIFIDFCNSKDIEKAYALLSSDCKKELFPTLQDFKDNYYDDIFKSKKLYSIKNWKGSIYILNYTDDILSSGIYNKESTIQDYITIVEEGEEYRLNINGFIGIENINKEKEIENVEIRIIQKKIYMDYEIYDIEMENNTGYTIILDSLDKNNTMYLTDTNKIKHYALSNEIIMDSLIVKDRYKGKTSIKFNNPYISGRKISAINFDAIAIGYGQSGYLGYKDVISCSIDL